MQYAAVIYFIEYIPFILCKRSSVLSQMNNDIDRFIVFQGY